VSRLFSVWSRDRRDVGGPVEATEPAALNMTGRGIDSARRGSPPLVMYEVDFLRPVGREVGGGVHPKE
jgi:hypothetical protein